MDDTESLLKQAEASVLSAKAAVTAARINLDYTRIAAPISGRIGKSSVTEGALVAVGQPTALSVIQQLNPMYVDVSQSTAELMRLKQRMADGRLEAGVLDQKKIRLVPG